jgi:hypothetical protein
MHSFKSLYSFTVNGRPCFAVENPEQCDDFAHLIGHEIEIDGRRCKVLGVERYAHTPPFRKGEHISLLTDLPNV